MKAQAFDGISRDLGQVSTRRSMTRLLGGVAALSAVVIGGRREAEAKKKNKKKAKSGAPGPVGPAGAAGPAGAPGAPGTPGAPLTVSSFFGRESAVLGAAVGTFVDSTAQFGVDFYPVNCGWTYIGDASDFEHTTTQVSPEFSGGVGFCRARLRRTATVGSAGGRILVLATGVRVEPSQSS